MKPLFGKKALDQCFIALINDNSKYAYYLHVKHYWTVGERRQTTKILEGELSFFHKIGFVFVFITYSLSNFDTFLLKGKNKELQEGENQ